MNKKIALFASICMLAMTVAISAQDKMADYSGDWKLDVEKSELGSRSNIESMTMNVTQSETELSVKRDIKRKAGDQSIGGALGGGNSGRGRQRMREGAFPITKYDLSGKETTVEMADGIMTGETKLKAKFDNGKLILTQNRTLNTPRGKRDVKTVETWEMSKDGNTLTVSSEMQTPRGNRSSKMVFVKSLENTKSIDSDDDIWKGNRDLKIKEGQILNGKALSLPVPVYPSEAKENNIKGNVEVQVIIDVKGNIVKAEAISGPIELREAAVEAAQRAKFSPTLLEGQPVIVSGKIVYKFN